MVSSLLMLFALLLLSFYLSLIAFLYLPSLSNFEENLNYISVNMSKIGEGKENILLHC